MSRGEMWAVQYRSYGGPEVLEVGRVPIPAVGARQVLVEVAAFSLNQADLMARAGKLKGFNGFGFPKGTGVDFVGTVVRADDRVTDVKIGDRVWGYIGMQPPGRHAAAAQYLAIGTNRIAIAPSRISPDEAAALPLAGLTAVQALHTLRVGRGKRVLVIGGNGGVGSTSIQVARALGARVDAVTGHRHEAARQAGSTLVFNYHERDPSGITERYDAILATAAGNLLAYRKLLNRGGRIVALSPSAIPAILASAFSPGPTIRMISAGPSSDDLEWLTDRVDDGAITPIVDTTYPLDHVAHAHRDAERRSASGKRVITTRRR